VCLGPANGGALEIRQLPRQEPASDEVEVAVEAASVNPIDVRRSEGYGRRGLSLLGAAKFPLVLGNDFAGTITARGSRVSSLRIGDRVYGVKPPSARGTHACHVLVKADYAKRAPADHALQDLATLPYSFITMWLAVRGAGLTRQNASRRRVLVHGAPGGSALSHCKCYRLGERAPQQWPDLLPLTRAARLGLSNLHATLEYLQRLANVGSPAECCAVLRAHEIENQANGSTPPHRALYKLSEHQSEISSLHTDSLTTCRSTPLRTYAIDLRQSYSTAGRSQMPIGRL